LPLTNLSEKYGYAKDYLGWLSRTGRIEAVRHGKYGQWYASEESLKKYQLSLIPFSNSKTIPSVESQPVVSESIPNEAARARSVPLLRTGSKPETSLSVPPLPAETTPVSISHEPETIIAPNVLLLPSQDNSFTAKENIVLCKNDGSYSAEGPERINAILTLSIVLGGILFFTQFFYSFILCIVGSLGQNINKFTFVLAANYNKY